MVATKSTSAPLITVFGATGNMGGSTVNHLMKSDKEYRIRAVSRDPSSGKSKELVKEGVEVVKGDFANDEELNGALKGADYVFVSVVCRKMVHSIDRALDSLTEVLPSVRFPAARSQHLGPGSGEGSRVDQEGFRCDQEARRQDGLLLFAPSCQGTLEWEVHQGRAL